MPGGRKRPGDKPEVLKQNHLLWEQTGALPAYQVRDWEPRSQEFVDAILEILTTGATVVLRPGSGGRSVGIAIWEGDVRHAPKWLYDQDEVDQWAIGITQRAEAIRGVQEDDERA